MMQTKTHKSPAWFKTFQKVKDNVVRSEIRGAELSYRGFTRTESCCLLGRLLRETDLTLITKLVRQHLDVMMSVRN